MFPPPLSLKRNEQGFTSEFNLDQHNLLGKAGNDMPDGDSCGNYHGSSIRRGPYMLNKQEDRTMVHEKFGESPINGLYGIADGHAGF